MENNDIPNIKKCVEKNGLSGLKGFLTGQLQEWEDVEINIGVTGDCGAGKSSFINAIRGLQDDDEHAAETGVAETTKEPTAYTYAKANKIKFWDLPGIGTPNYPNIDTYCNKVDLKKYDTFLILTAGRFTENNLQLATKVKSMKKSFFFVRTKIDQDIKNERERKKKKTFNEELTLNAIRKMCWDNLKDLAAGEQDVFLISNHKRAKWEFSRLTQAILDALPVNQKESLTLSLDVLETRSKDLVERKVKILRGRIWKVAATSAAVAAVPVPGLSLAFDVKLFKTELNFYISQLGLPGENCKQDGSLPPEIYAKLQNVYASNAVQVGVLSAAYGVGSTAAEFSRVMISALGSAFAGGLSFGTACCFLDDSLTKLREIALDYLEQIRAEVNHEKMESPSVDSK